MSRLAQLLQATDERRYDPALLRELLQHPDPAVRRQAALAAGRMGNGAAVDLLTPVLTDSAEAVAAAAAYALGILRDAGALPVLLTTVRADTRASVQSEAVTAIAKIGSDAGAQALRQILQQGNAAVAVPPPVSAALFEAWRLGEAAPVDEMMQYAESPDFAVRYRVLYSLGRLRTRNAAPAVLLGLSDRDPNVRAVAVRGVTRVLVDSARVDPRAIGARLRPLLDERDPPLRITILRNLAGFRDSSFAPLAAAMLTDADPGVIVQAESTLGALGGRAALDALRPRLASAVYAIRRQAAIGVAQAGHGADSADLGTFRALAADPDWRWRSVAAEAYAAAGLRDPLQALVADADGRVAAQALGGLARLTPATDTVLKTQARQWLGHADPAVRSIAADQLARAPSPDDVDRLVAAYRSAEGDPIDDARLSIVGALGAIAQASAAGRLAVVNRFLTAVPRPTDYLVHRMALSRIPDAAEVWGTPGPIATGRTPDYYREVVRRWLGPALLGQPNPRVTIETDRGALEVELFPTEAPLTVAAFEELVERRFFDGGRWHRVVPNFVIQDGDPRGDGWGGPGFVLRDEVNPLRYLPGSMGMALSGPDTGGSQFFIALGQQPHLDGTYPVFGRVVGGQGVLPNVMMGDRIRSIHR